MELKIVHLALNNDHSFTERGGPTLYQTTFVGNNLGRFRSITGTLDLFLLFLLKNPYVNNVD
jgi:hypothetical protein